MVQESESIIIGSGPTGLSAALGRIALGEHVLLLDIGGKLEPERQALENELFSTPKEQWSQDDINSIKWKATDKYNLPRKLFFGSSGPYGKGSNLINDASGLASLYSTFQGGFSSVWGACVLPYRDQELSHWPITRAQLEPSFNSISEIMRISGAADSLSNYFGIKWDEKSFLEPTAQSIWLTQHLARHHHRLKNEGISWGNSRIALSHESTAHSDGCVYCGLCMHGCAKRVIFSAADLIDKLHKIKKLNYLSPYEVLEVGEDNRPFVLAKNRISGELKKFLGKKVFIACGAIPSSVLYLKSVKRPPHSLTIKDSQYFLVPVLLDRGFRELTNGKLWTLSQLFFEIQNSFLSHHNLHLQLYGYNDLFNAQLPFPLRWIEALVPGVCTTRIGVLQGYLHSDDSGRVELGLHDRDSAVNLKTIFHKNSSSVPLINRLMSMLFRARKELGFSVISKFMKIAPICRGYHFGASLPMQTTAGANHCDPLGRTIYWENIHFVDTSTFPCIPSLPITLTAMANANRIALHA